VQTITLKTPTQLEDLDLGGKHTANYDCTCAHQQLIETPVVPRRRGYQQPVVAVSIEV
jgi:hypothetical protein